MNALTAIRQDLAEQAMAMTRLDAPLRHGAGRGNGGAHRHGGGNG